MTREEAIEAIKIAQAQVEWDYSMDYAAAFDMAAEALKQPEIVRCKDCKYFANEKDGVACSFFDGLVSCEENDFCSYGERKDGESK